MGHATYTSRYPPPHMKGPLQLKYNLFKVDLPSCENEGMVTTEYTSSIILTLFCSLQALQPKPPHCSKSCQCPEGLASEWIKIKMHKIEYIYIYIHIHFLQLLLLIFYIFTFSSIIFQDLQNGS